MPCVERGAGRSKGLVQRDFVLCKPFICFRW